MAASPVVTLCSALVTDLLAQHWVLPLEAERGYLPRYDLKDLDTVRAFVAPAAHSKKGFDRGHAEWELQVWIGILARLRPAQSQRVDSDDVTQLDDLMQLVADVMARYAPDANEVFTIEVTDGVTNHGTAVIDEVENDPAYDDRALEEERRFTSVLLVTARLQTGY